MKKTISVTGFNNHEHNPNIPVHLRNLDEEVLRIKNINQL